MEDRSSSSIFLDDRKVEELSSGRDRGAGIRVIVGETTGFAHTADLSEAGLLRGRGGRGRRPRRRRRRARGRALQAATGPSSGGDLAELGSQVRQGGPAATGRRRLPFGRRRRRAGECRIWRQPATNPRRELDGLLAGDDRVRTRFFVTCVASGDGGMQTGSESLAYTLGFDMFDDHPIEEAAEKAAQRAISKLTARPAPSGVLPVVLKRGSGGFLFHEACGHGLEADHILKDSSVYTGRVGQLVASPGVTLVDDGTSARTRARS